MPVPSTPADEMATQQWFILSIYRFSLSSIVYAPFHTQLEKHHKENDKLLTLCKQIFAENFYHASFQKSLSDMEKKRIKKKRKETDYQRRYKNEWIAPKHIYSSMEPGKYIIFLYTKTFFSLLSFLYKNQTKILRWTILSGS